MPGTSGRHGDVPARAVRTSCLTRDLLDGAGFYTQATELGPPRPGLGSGAELGDLIYIQKQKEAYNLEEIIQV